MDLGTRLEADWAVGLGDAPVAGPALLACCLWYSAGGPLLGPRLAVGVASMSLTLGDAMSVKMFELSRQDMVGFVELAGRTCRMLLRQVGLA